MRFHSNVNRSMIAVTAVTLCAAALLLRPAGPDAYHVSGDGAAAVTAALSRLGAPLATEAGAAGTEVVLLRRWQSLDHLPGIKRLCRAACDGRAPLVDIAVPGWAGWRRIRLIDLGAYGGGGALDRGDPLPAPVAENLARRALTGDPSAGMRIWRLPSGL